MDKRPSQYCQWARKRSTIHIPLLLSGRVKAPVFSLSSENPAKPNPKAEQGNAILFNAPGLLLLPRSH